LTKSFLYISLSFSFLLIPFSSFPPFPFSSFALNPYLFVLMFQFLGFLPNLQSWKNSYLTPICDTSPLNGLRITIWTSNIMEFWCTRYFVRHSLLYNPKFIPNYTLSWHSIHFTRFNTITTYLSNIHFNIE
jgi:hypothetical protein